MIESHHTKADNHRQRDGRRYIQHVFVDHLGLEHKTGKLLVDGELSESEFKPQRLALIDAQNKKLANNEIDSFISKLKKNVNPFRDTSNILISPEYQTYEKAITSVADYLMGLSGGELLDYRHAFEHLFNLGTDQELKYLLQLSDQELAEIRTREQFFKQLNSAVSVMETIKNG